MKENPPTARRYDREFKGNAVALVGGGRTITRVARDLGITTGSLGHWVQADRAGQRQHEPATLAAEAPEMRTILSLNRSTGFLRGASFFQAHLPGLDLHGVRADAHGEIAPVL